MADRMDQSPAGSAGTLTGRLDPASDNADSEPGMSMPLTPDSTASPLRPVELDLTDDEPPTPTYTCTVCGTSGPWGPEWSWYGSWRELDKNPSAIVNCCSVACRKQHAANNALAPGLVD